MKISGLSHDNAQDKDDWRVRWESREQLANRGLLENTLCGCINWQYIYGVTQVG